MRVAIALHWGTGPEAPIVFSCEGHMQRRFRERAHDEDRLPGIDIWNLWPRHDRHDPNPIPGRLWSRDDYRALLDKVLAYDPELVKNISSWIRRHDRTIRRQFDLREQHSGFPRSSGAVESGIVKIGDWLGERTRSLQNVRRMNIMLGLMRANLGGHADPSLYSRIIRDELARTGGRPKLNWREFHLSAKRPGALLRCPRRDAWHGIRRIRRQLPDIGRSTGATARLGASRHGDRGRHRFVGPVSAWRHREALIAASNHSWGSTRWAETA